MQLLVEVEVFYSVPEGGDDSGVADTGDGVLLLHEPPHVVAESLPSLLDDVVEIPLVPSPFGGTLVVANEDSAELCLGAN